MQKLIIIFLFILSSSVCAQVFIVNKLRGKVAYNKRLVKRGDFIRAPGIMVTAGKSFIQLQGKEGKLTLGPGSKIYLSKSQKKGPTLLQVLKGKLRGQINKKANNDYKLFIKTRSASLGVRGTDFIVVYNDRNHITSSLTLNGKVVFYKKDDKEILKSLREDFDEKNISLNYAEEKMVIRDELSNYKSVQVEKGKFSGAYPTYERPLSPTMISRRQADIFKKDDSLGANPLKRQRTILVNRTKGKFKLTNKNLIPEPMNGDNETKLADDSNKQTINGTVRQGGILDTNTGIYIMPPKGSRYNKKTKLYMLPEQYGGLDSSTGEYRPPKNVELDPLKGFVRIENGKRIPVDSFSKSVRNLFDKYKKLSRVDIFADARYFYSLKSYENYYGEITNISNAESMIFNLAGNIGRYIFNNKRYKHYIKAGLEFIYHSRQREPLVQRNDRFVSHYGYEFHRKHFLLGRKASFIFDIDFETIYQDYKSRKQWDFYTESINFKIFERLKTSRRHKMDIGIRIAPYQGHSDQNHGNIYEAFIFNKINPNIPWEFELNYFFRHRESKIDNNKFDISALEFVTSKLDIFRKTNLSYLAQVWWSDSRQKIDYDHGVTYQHKLEVIRRKGEYLKFNAFYSYMRNKAKGVGSNRNFIQQLWGGGIKFIF